MLQPADIRAVQLHHNTVPGLDGSGIPFVRTVLKVGSAGRKLLRPDKPRRALERMDFCAVGFPVFRLKQALEFPRLCFYRRAELYQRITQHIHGAAMLHGHIRINAFRPPDICKLILFPRLRRLAGFRAFRDGFHHSRRQVAADYGFKAFRRNGL